MMSRKMPNLPRRLREGLDEADDLLSKYKQPEEALELLQDLNKRYPRQADVLGIMANTYLDLGDKRGYLNTMYKLHKIMPNRGDVKFGLAGAYLSNGRFALAYQTFGEFLKKWKHHERVKDAEDALVMLKEGLDDILAQLGLDFEDGLKFAAQHELLQVFMGLGEYRQCKQLAKRLIKERPNFTPTFNNLSQIAWLEGDLNEAIEFSLKTLEIEDDNVHALSNLARFMFMQGDEEAARLYAERLVASEADASDLWTKKIEALAFIRDDESVLAIYKEVENAKEIGLLDYATLHWVAVAFYNKGDIKSARKYWEKSLQIDPYFSLAKANLDALDLPETNRDCPQVFTMDMWLSHKILNDLSSAVGKAASKKEEDGDAFRKVVADFIDKRPEIIRFVSMALSWGDVKAKETAFYFTDMSGHPELLDLLKIFALGKSGTDSSRIEASQILTKYDVFTASENVELWLEGGRRELMMMNYEIYYGPEEEDIPFNAKVMRLLELGLEALHDGDGVEAEQFLRQALKKHPDDPSILNNLAGALYMQDREEEAEELISRIANEFPDYFFGQLTAARKAINAGKLERAKTYIDKMASKKKLHVTEFGALCAVHISFLIKDDKPEGALSWYEMWVQGYPEDPKLEDYAEQIEMIKMMKKLKPLVGDKKKHEKKKNKKSGLSL
jgi:tetratricopeptide (TPR) repeat protein